jgi:hypothetical protein
MRARMVELSLSGLRVPAIAVELGCSQKTVRCWLRRFNRLVTAGTEVGHDPGPYCHRNGYKVDMCKQDGCLDRYIPSHFKRAGARKDGTKLYKSAAGNVYARETNDWDVLCYNGRA